MRALIAGFGNIAAGDDAYGSEVIRVLKTQGWPDSVRVADFGTHGMDVAFEMLEGYDLVIFVNVVTLGKAPGTLLVVEPDALTENPNEHAQELQAALKFYEGLEQDMSSGYRPRVIIVGCEPQSLDIGKGLSPVVAAAVPATIPFVLKVLAQHGIGVGIYEGIC